MKLINKLKSFFIKKIDINIIDLPSRGYFYKNDLKISIKRVDKIDIDKYEDGFNINDLSDVLKKIKYIVKNNITCNYNFESIKSIDIIYIFLEIVKFTKNKKIIISYINPNGELIDIEFSNKTFNYFEYEKFIDNWDIEQRSFSIDGYLFSLPSIGVENSLTDFLTIKSFQLYDEADIKRYNSYNYSFVYFVGSKEKLDMNEIENLIQIFNYDIDDNEKIKIEKIMNLFLPINRYTLKSESGEIIELSSKVDLMNIWK